MVGLKEGDTMFESGIGRLPDGRWCWSARGIDLPEYCSIHEPDWLPIEPPDGWINVGPFKTKRSAARNLERFEGN